MIKILFMIHDLGQGGAEKVLVNLVNNMDLNKYDVSLISLFGGGVNEQFLKKGIKYRSIFKKNIPGNSKLMKLLSPEKLHSLFVKESYDIEISYLEGSTARIVSGCQNKNTKLISWIHVEQHSKEIAAKAFRSFEESVKCYCKFNGIVCVSESVKVDFCDIYPMISKVDVLYNTNETDYILKAKNEAITEQSFKNNEIRICGVGKIMPIKGFDKLARIHKKLIQEGFPVHTYILGIGIEKENIERYIKENCLEKTFTFLGYQTNPYKYMAKCDLFVCASTAEGFSTAATEALIVGIPVITTPVAGMEEMLGKENEYGIITKATEESLYENIKDLVSHPEKLQYYKDQAKLRGKNFSKKNTVKAVEDYIDKVLGEGHKS